MQALRRFGWLVAIAAAGPAQAHAPIAGIEGFYIGLLHPFSTPAQALVLIGLGLLIPGLAAETSRWPLGSFLVCVLFGVFLGSAAWDLDAMLFALAATACALAALFPGRLSVFAIALAALGGFLIGAVSIPDAGPARDRIITMSGSVVGANLGLLYIFGFAYVVRERYTWPWVAIAFRVAAAWLGAIALLMLALGVAVVDGPA